VNGISKPMSFANSSVVQLWWIFDWRSQSPLMNGWFTIRGLDPTSIELTLFVTILVEMLPILVGA